MKQVWRLKWMVVVIALCLLVPLGSCGGDDDGDASPSLSGTWSMVDDGMRQTFVMTENTIKAIVEVGVFGDWLTYRIVEGTYSKTDDQIKITITKITAPNADLSGGTAYTSADAEWALLLASIEQSDETINLIYSLNGNSISIKDDPLDDWDVLSKISDEITPVYKAEWMQTFTDNEGEKRINLTIGAMNFFMEMQMNAQLGWITLMAGEGMLDVNDEEEIVSIYLNRIGVFNDETQEMDYYVPTDQEWDMVLSEIIEMPEAFNLKWSLSGDELTIIIDVNEDGVYDPIEESEVYTRV